MNARLLEFIEKSVIGPLLGDEEVTDVSYNGTSLYYQHNRLGRKKSDIELSPQDATDFIRQIANLSEQEFSFSSPILDVSVGRYRVNAVHSSITRVGDDKGVSFSIRLASETSRVESDREFMDEEARKILERAVKERASIIIGGAAGSGKTELQKYLLGKVDRYSRIIVIDNINELEHIRINADIDVTSWHVNRKASESTFEALIANALRSNPDWLIVSEARGREMASVLLSAMTGHPIITTLHARSIKSMPRRIARLIQLADPAQKAADILRDVYAHFAYFVFLEMENGDDGSIRRRLKEIAKVDEESSELVLIYQRGKGGKEKSPGLPETVPAAA